MFLCHLRDGDVMSLGLLRIARHSGSALLQKIARACWTKADGQTIVISEWYYLNPANRVQSQVEPSGNTAGAAAESMDINNHNVTSDDAVKGDQNAADQYADVSRITADDANDNTVLVVDIPDVAHDV